MLEELTVFPTGKTVAPGVQRCAGLGGVMQSPLMQSFSVPVFQGHAAALAWTLVFFTVVFCPWTVAGWPFCEEE